MARQTIHQLDPKNDLPRRQASEGHPVSREIDADCGYAVLDRADPGSYDRNREGLSPRVYDSPNIAFDEE
jgi:hypothetical protein